MWTDGEVGGGGRHMQTVHTGCLSVVFLQFNARPLRPFQGHRNAIYLSRLFCSNQYFTVIRCGATENTTVSAQ